MSALFSLSSVMGLVLAMWAAYVMARFVTGYPKQFVDGWEREELGGESR